jgi:hypothetical protein
MCGVLLAAAWVVLCAGTVSALDVYVDDDNCPGPGSGGDLDPYCKIQDAICSIKDSGGGTVFVRPGDYNESLRMFTGVSVISTDGPAVTTINADGKPCITQACVESLVNLTCSTVVYGTGPTNADRLEGFRISGGAGLFRNFGGSPPNALTGGAIFVFNSSPTITMNEIVDNQLFHANYTREFWGGAIYLGGGDFLYPTQPMITSNLIQENVADPPAGGNQNSETYALGGAIYTGLYTAPIIDGNTITSNQAGDTNKLHQLGGGGGLSIYSISPTAAPRITNNLIQDNSASDFGGGVGFGQAFLDTTYYPAFGLVENNIIELNRSFTGGGLHVTTSQVVARSNTIADNTAEFGGGVTTSDQRARQPRRSAQTGQQHRGLQRLAALRRGRPGYVLSRLPRGDPQRHLREPAQRRRRRGGGRGLHRSGRQRLARSAVPQPHTGQSRPAAHRGQRGDRPRGQRRGPGD